MDDATGSSQITDNPEASRFEITSGGHLAELQYRRRADRLVLLHTEVPAELEGHGMGSSLVAAAVDWAIRENLTVVPLCPFARSWLEGHPEVAARATIDWGSD